MISSSNDPRAGVKSLIGSVDEELSSSEDDSEEQEVTEKDVMRRK